MFVHLSYLVQTLESQTIFFHKNRFVEWLWNYYVLLLNWKPIMYPIYVNIYIVFLYKYYHQIEFVYLSYSISHEYIIIIIIEKRSWYKYKHVNLCDIIMLWLYLWLSICYIIGMLGWYFKNKLSHILHLSHHIHLPSWPQIGTNIYCKTNKIFVDGNWLWAFMDIFNC